eukprot:14731883-Heterocapsa_arctica.AAC.1
MRVDAKAEGLKVCVGGWRPVLDEGGAIDTMKSPWSAVELDESSAPWAYEKGLPYRAISALELVASTLALIVFGPDLLVCERADAVVLMSGLSDSQ